MVQLSCSGEGKIKWMASHPIETIKTTITQLRGSRMMPMLMMRSILGFPRALDRGNDGTDRYHADC
jgi:hypothetical protein